MYHSKFRAECTNDILELLRRLDENSIPCRINIAPIEDGKYGAEAVIKTHHSRQELIKLMKQVPDGHVMWQTLAPVECYTGERDYSI